MNEAISKFLSIVPDLLPEICDNRRLYESHIYEDYALLPYALKRPLKMEEIKAILEEKEEMRIYYLLQYEGRESLCAYSNPCMQSMFKINAITDNSGYAFDVNVTVYDSLEIMSSELVEELRLVDTGCKIYKKEFGEFLADFT